MPVILDPNSEAMQKWLDPSITTWSKDLQSILKPYEGELECYPVSKEVGKVGNNSPEFIVPVDSAENKSNIANFFANAKKKEVSPKKEPASPVTKIKDERAGVETTPGAKRAHADDTAAAREDSKKAKLEQSLGSPSPQKMKMRSATHNTPLKKASGKKPPEGSQRITNFFKK